MADEPKKPVILPSYFGQDSIFSYYAPSADQVIGKVETKLGQLKYALTADQKTYLEKIYVAEKQAYDSSWWYSGGLPKVYLETVRKFNDPDAVAAWKADLAAGDEVAKAKAAKLDLFVETPDERKARLALEAANKTVIAPVKIDAEREARLKHEAAVKLVEEAERERQAGLVAAAAERERQAGLVAAAAERERQAGLVAAAAERERQAGLVAKTLPDPVAKTLPESANTQPPKDEPSIFDQFARNFAEVAKLDSNNPETMRLFGHVHSMALRGEDGLKLPPKVREAFYKFLEENKYLKAPENGHPPDFKYPLNFKDGDTDVGKAAQAWKDKVLAEQNKLFCDDPSLRDNANLHDGVAGKVTLTEIARKKNNPPPA